MSEPENQEPAKTGMVQLSPVSKAQFAVAKEKVFIGKDGKLVGEKDVTTHTLFAHKGEQVPEEKLAGFENLGDFF